MFYHNKIVLVTGGTGMVGLHIVEELLKAGARVRVPIHSRSLQIKHENIETLSADLMRPEDCLRVTEGVDYVVHAAGATAGAGVSALELMPLLLINTVLTSNMLEAAWRLKVKRFLVFSSSTGYPAFEHPVREDEMWLEPPHPSYMGYGWQRRYMEKLAEYVHDNSDTKIAIVRPTAVYGRWDNFSLKAGHVIPSLIARALENEDPFVVWGGGKECRDFLHISDFARGSLLVLEKHAVCDAINIGFGQSVTIEELVRVILDACGRSEVKIVFDSSKPTKIPYRAVSTEKAAALLGFKPQITLKEGIKDTVSWYNGCAII
ncbi:NAD-dependent epimerase/dehydratase family protein [Candidatus Magnetomonas plexicatena]|uniref:NAD-dependent epimerase/dehydratase family protein n=1 Tax=Candidatus Magnetomonas plexicatena TaxID=2552947 RepID=UPI001C7812CD|nr:NAD-dependent epimerase/dehydratase family protein [Nitrospirales bacterium LBB_01]